MKIQRYVNGKAVSENELSGLSVVTPELSDALWEARRRMQQAEDAKGSESDRHE